MQVLSSPSAFFEVLLPPAAGVPPTSQPTSVTSSEGREDPFKAEGGGSGLKTRSWTCKADLVPDVRKESELKAKGTAFLR